VSWYDPRTWIGSSDGRSQAELQAERDQLDARIAAQNSATYQRIQLQSGNSAANDWLAQVNDNLATQDSTPVSEAVAADFNAGAEEGLQNAAGVVRAGINLPARFLLSAIPWWVWIVAAGALFIYLGGGAVVRRKVSSL
jgi:hypothetical protein